MKRTLAIAAMILVLALAGCGKQSPAAGAQQSGEAVQLPDPRIEITETVAPQAPAAPSGENGRKDGERFEAAIILEGMEETVRYEHIRNETIGIEMDYDYESFVRQSEADRECFVSIYDDSANPENYLEVTYSTENAETVAEAVRAALSQEYDLLESSRELGLAGKCIRLEASELKGTGKMPDQLQAVYIIPASDGCRVATEHYAIEAAEGFGRRFSYILNTLTVIERRKG